MTENRRAEGADTSEWIAPPVPGRLGDPIARRTFLGCLDRNPLFLPLAAALLVLGIETVDYFAGAQFDLTILQAIPVLVVARYGGRGFALAIAGLGASAWLLVHLLTGQHYANVMVPFWNAAAGFGFLSLAAILLSRLRSDLSEKEDLLRHLETALVERARAEKALEQKARELSRSNEDLEQYASIAAHDLKSPLVAVGGFAQLLHRRLSESNDRDVVTCTDQILSGVTRMRSLIDDLLSFARAGGEQGAPEPVDCNFAFDFAFASAKEEAPDAFRGITRSELPRVMAHEGQVVQLFQNLLSNALKFRRTEPPAVHTTAQKHGAEWVFAVEDNGIGIAPEHLELVFGLFRRLPGDVCPRDRARACHLPQDRGTKRRQDLGRVDGGPGVDLPLHVAGSLTRFRGSGPRGHHPGHRRARRRKHEPCVTSFLARARPGTTRSANSS